MSVSVLIFSKKDDSKFVLECRGWKFVEEGYQQIPRKLSFLEIQWLHSLDIDYSFFPF